MRIIASLIILILLLNLNMSKIKKYYHINPPDKIFISIKIKIIHII
jgi:hypothetical protein